MLRTTSKIQQLANSVMIAAIATTTMSVVAQAGTIRHDRLDSQYRDLANLFPSVGRLSLQTSSGGSLCSGTLVAANWVLTAAHCIDNVRSGSFNVGGNNYSLVSAVTNKGWVDNNRDLSKGFDIGLYQLKSSVTNVRAASLFTTSNENSQVGTYVGFGATGTGVTGYNPNSAGVKRSGQNTINLGSTFRFSNQLLVSDFDDPRTANSRDASTQPLNLEYNIAPGDSGGGLFINGLLAGVNSFISETDGSAKSKGLVVDADYGDISAATRVSSFVGWIQNVITRTSASSISTASTNSSTPLNIQYVSAAVIPENAAETTTISLWDDSFADQPQQVTEPGLILALLSVGGMMKLFTRRSKPNLSSSQSA